MYRDGLGVPQDNDKAIEWFRLSAEQGYESARYALDELEMQIIKSNANKPSTPTTAKSPF